jgi:transposase
LSEKRTYRKFTPQQKLELVMASWRGERSIAELCREHDRAQEIAETPCGTGSRHARHPVS